MTRVHAQEQTDVQEPILSEKRSCLKGGCFSSCGCLFMVGILLLLVLRISWGPRTVNLSVLPDHFPASISVFEPDALDGIKITRAADANRPIATLTALPRLAYNPVRAVLDIKNDGGGSVVDYIVSAGREIRAVFISPGNAQSIDRIKLSWDSMLDDIETVRGFYLQSFEESGVRADIRFDNANNFEVDFSRGDVSGTLLIENYDLRTKGIEGMTLTVDVPHSLQ